MLKLLALFIMIFNSIFYSRWSFPLCSALALQVPPAATKKFQTHVLKLNLMWCCNIRSVCTLQHNTTLDGSMRGKISLFAKLDSSTATNVGSVQGRELIKSICRKCWAQHISEKRLNIRKCWVGSLLRHPRLDDRALSVPACALLLYTSYTTGNRSWCWIFLFVASAVVLHLWEIVPSSSISAF